MMRIAELFPYVFRLFLPSFLMQLFINAPSSFLRRMDNFTGLIEFGFGILWNLSHVIQTFDLRQSIATICVLLWSFRLGGFLIYRMICLGLLDTRIDDLAKKYGRWIIVAFWFGPHGFWSTLCCCPVILLYAYPMENVRWNLLDSFGLIIWFSGFLMESIADHLKLKAKLNGQTNRYYHLGHLWNYSRNPNHCGEVFCWLGLALIASNVVFSHPLHRFNLLMIFFCVISPGFTLFAMVAEASLASEIRNNRRYGDQFQYLDYRKRTSLLWPIPSHIYIRLPKVIRRTLFFDWKMYDQGLKRKDT